LEALLVRAEWIWAFRLMEYAENLADAAERVGLTAVTLVVK
jgi:hypothetical protein